MVLYEYMKAKRALLVISVLVGCIVLAQSARGITYQSETTVEFTLNSSNTLTISGDAILALAPGTFGTSSSITVVMTTTNLTGAKLMADVGKNESPYAIAQFTEPPADILKRFLWPEMSTALAAFHYATRVLMSLLS